MSLARSLERRLERLFEGATGRVFSGRLHPSEMAGRIAREADLSRYRHESGPATANKYVLTVSPADLDVDPSSLEKQLAAALAEHAASTGLLFEGPPTVVIQTSASIPPGQFRCEPSVVPGRLPPWARLAGSGATLEIGANRVIIGRSDEADLVLPYDNVSRKHALVWRSDGQAWIRDLGSANGTSVDGAAVGDHPVPIGHGSVVSLAGHRYRFLGH
ncbi:MAG TPA: FhaA domain-containing protein [Acidimicrobiia bacterium]